MASVRHPRSYLSVQRVLSHYRRTTFPSFGSMSRSTRSSMTVDCEIVSTTHCAERDAPLSSSISSALASAGEFRLSLFISRDVDRDLGSLYRHLGSLSDSSRLAWSLLVYTTGPSTSMFSRLWWSESVPIPFSGVFRFSTLLLAAGFGSLNALRWRCSLGGPITPATDTAGDVPTRRLDASAGSGAMRLHLASTRKLQSSRRN